VITMLPSNPHVQQVYGGPDGVFAGMRKGALLIDCSTIDPNVARAVGGQAAIKTVRVCVCTPPPVVVASGGVGVWRRAGCVSSVPDHDGGVVGAHD
jgi:hypothetical protein